MKNQSPQDANLAAPAEVLDANDLVRHTFTPRPHSSVYAWDYDMVIAARDAHMRGRFDHSEQLMEATKTDPAVFGCLLQRLTPHRALPISYDGARKSTLAEAAATFAPAGVELADNGHVRLRRSGVLGHVLPDALEVKVMCGFGITQTRWTARANGARLDPFPERWPLSAVRYDTVTKKLMALTNDGEETIRHGDGRWTIWADHYANPWNWAALKAIGVTWSDRSFARRDQAVASELQTLMKIVGELPENMTMKMDTAKSIARMVSGLRGPRAGGVFPHGGDLHKIEANGQGYQLLAQALKFNTTEVARVLLGQDGTLTNEGGNYKKNAQMGTVKDHLIESDLIGAASSVNTGLLRPWQQINHGRDGLYLYWGLPDPELERKRTAFAKRVKDFNAAVTAYAANFELTKTFVEELGRKLSVPVPDALKDMK